jgi:hypothetical protein
MLFTLALFSYSLGSHAVRGNSNDSILQFPVYAVATNPFTIQSRVREIKLIYYNRVTTPIKIMIEVTRVLVF